MSQRSVPPTPPPAFDRQAIARQAPTADTRFVTASYANMVFHTLGGGPQIEAIFREHGLDPAGLTDAATPIAFDRLAESVFAVMEALDMPDAGLSLGSRLHVSKHGTIGMAVISAETLGQAIKDIAKYYQTAVTFCDMDLFYQGDQLILELREEFTSPEVRVIVVEALMLTLQNALEFVSGRALTDSRVIFGYPPPPYADQYDLYFSGKTEFDGERHLMILPASIQNVRCVSADARIHRLAEEQLQHQLQELRTGTPIHQRILAELRRNTAAMPTLKEMAGIFNVSTRTLIRHLQAEGTTYRDLRDSVHKQMAMEALRNTDQSIDAIALELGYQDTASFRRAFKRWCGCSASEYRERERNP
jgi:AraC-like DNA-binding protein